MSVAPITTNINPTTTLWSGGGGGGGNTNNIQASTMTMSSDTDGLGTNGFITFENEFGNSDTNTTIQLRYISPLGSGYNLPLAFYKGISSSNMTPDLAPVAVNRVLLSDTLNSSYSMTLNSINNGQGMTIADNTGAMILNAPSISNVAFTNVSSINGYAPSGASFKVVSAVGSEPTAVGLTAVPAILTTISSLSATTGGMLSLQGFIGVNNTTGSAVDITLYTNSAIQGVGINSPVAITTIPNGAKGTVSVSYAQTLSNVAGSQSVSLRAFSSSPISTSMGTSGFSVMYS